MEGNPNARSGHDDQWTYKPEGVAPKTQSPVASVESVVAAPVSAVSKDSIEWTASEFVAHEKDFKWYAILFFGAAIIAFGSYAITRDIFSTVVIIIFACIVGVIAARKPRTVSYRLDEVGISVGKMTRPYSAFKSFAVIDEGPFASVVLVPMRRFDLPLSIYLAPENGTKALEALSRHLPLEQGKLDLIEELMRQLRF